MKQIIRKSFYTVLLLAGVNQAWAVPTLQLGIVDGIYDTYDETILSTSGDFTLVAYGKGTDDGDGNFKKLVNTTDHYYLSIAVTPSLAESPSAPDIGSFTLDGTTYDENNMHYGVPPIEEDGITADHDGGDLGKHGIFETYFMEYEFKFSDSMKTDSINTQVDPGFDPTANPGDDLFFMTFDINVAGLLPDYSLHFDLYDMVVKNNGDYDIENFAPFSHDAASGAVPEPGPLYLLSVALLLLLLSQTRLRRTRTEG